MASEVRAAARAVEPRRRANATASSCRAKTGTATSTPAAGRASVALRAFMKRGPRGAGTESVPTVHGDPPHQRRAPARALRVPPHPERLVRRRRPGRPRARGRVGVRAGARRGRRGGALTTTAATRSPSARSAAAGRTRPHVLVYGHYDVQTVGAARRPGTRRRSSPRCATATSTRAGRRTTRATSTRCSRRCVDLARAGELAVDVTVASDGEEEIGGDSVVRWLDEADAPFDAAIVFDGGFVGPQRPALTTGTRGIVQGNARGAHRLAATCTPASTAAPALNAAHVAADLIAATERRDGRLPDALEAGAVPPSPDEVRELGDPARRATAELRDRRHRAERPGRGRRVLRAHAGPPTFDVNALTCRDASQRRTIIPSEARHRLLAAHRATARTRRRCGRRWSTHWTSLLPAGAELETDAARVERGVAGSTPPCRRCSSRGEAIERRRAGTAPSSARAARSRSCPPCSATACPAS